MGISNKIRPGHKKWRLFWLAGKLSLAPNDNRDNIFVSRYLFTAKWKFTKEKVMKLITLRKGLIVALGFGALILGFSVYAAVNVTIADGVYANFEEFGGKPASTRMRTLTIAPGEILGWHNNPGVGAYTIVN